MSRAASVMTFQETKQTDGLTIVGPRDTEFTRSEVPSIPPISLKRGWLRPSEVYSSRAPLTPRSRDLATRHVHVD